jgi:hypothetical protein
MQTRRTLSKRLFIVYERALDEGADTRTLEEIRQVVENRPAACVDQDEEAYYDRLHEKLEKALFAVLDEELSSIGTVNDKGQVKLANGSRLAVPRRYLEKNILFDERISGRRLNLTPEAKSILGIVD